MTTTVDPTLADRLAKMSPAKRALFLKAAGFSPEAAQQILAAQGGAGIPARDPAAPVPMSFAQELQWRLERASPGFTYNVPKATRFQGPLDVAALQRAIDALVARHEILRTTFDVIDGQPQQIVHDRASVPIAVVDLTPLPPAEREEEARRVVREQSRRPFDLANDMQLRATLVRIADDDHVLLIESHHVASDVVSRAIVFRELYALYREALGGAPAQLPALRTQYADFAAWQRKQLVGDRLEKLLAYWRRQLDGAHALELPTDRRAAAYSTEGAMAARMFSPALVEGLRRLKATQGTTLFMALLAGVDAVLARYTAQDDVVVGSPIAGRPHGDLEGVVGYFVNTLVLRTSLDGNPTFTELLDRVRTTALAAYEHQDVPYELMLTELAESGRVGAGPLFNVMVSMLDGEARAIPLEGTRVAPFAANRGAAKFDLLFAFREEGDGLRASIEYRSELYAPETIDRLLGHLETLLTAAVAAPDTRVNALPLMNDAERSLVLESWNATARDYPDTTLVALLDAQVQRTPDAPAVTFEGDTISYRELHARADRLASALRAAGAQRGSLVGVCAERSIDLVVALVGVVKAGAAYVPLDPDYPADRLAFMLEDSAPSAVLTTGALADRVKVACPVLMLDQPATWPAGTTDRAEIAPEDPAYMIFTSGSTGRPKGALNAHRGIVNRLLWMQEQYQLSERDIVLQKTPYSFDVSVWEFFWPLLTGARLVVAKPGGHREPRYLAELIDRERVTVCHFVPSMLGAFLASLNTTDRSACPSLRHVVCSGEALTSELVAGTFAALANAQLHNLYGPTECAVDVTHWTCTPDDGRAGTNVPIGRPVANTQLYVLDPSGNPLPAGVPGELFLAGVQVGMGYHGRPELTAEKFVADPFARVPGARMYRTGDRARWRGDGVMEFLGRLDFQIKLRGFRIELGEIESVLAGHPSVRQAAVVAVDARDGMQLAAYYVPVDGAVDVAGLRTHLRERLPDYMVPAFLMPLDTIPLTASGKLDRKKLPAPQASESSSAYVAPRTTQEHQLVHIWKQLLEVRPIGIRDNFFDIGGHSLLAVRLLDEIEQMSGRRLPLATLFEDATIERLAKRIETAVHDEGEPPMVVLGPADARPFVFLHGDVRGGGWYCRGLSRLIGPTVKFVVLPTLRPTGRDDSSTVETMAAHHVAELRKVQPHGPYQLGGFCFGGVVAFEMAQQLRAAGERVERLILVDSALRNGPIARWRSVINLALPLQANGRSVQRRAAWLDRVNAIRRMSSKDRWEWVRRNVARRLPGAKPVPPQQRTGAIPDGEIWRRPATDVIRFEARGAAAYVPRAFPQPIDLIVAIDKPEVADADYAATMGADATQPRIGRRGWNFVSPDVRVHAVHATHVGLITDRLDTFAEYLRKCLDV